MLKYLIDGPNAITACGLVITIVSLFLAITGHQTESIALLMWAVMLDHIDGWLARQMKTRRREYSLVGGDMDSATDMISAAIVPSCIGISLTNGSTLSLISALIISLAACLRVGYFNNFGLMDNGRFYGVPLTYTVPMVGLVFILSRFFPSNIRTHEVLPWLLIVMGALHVSPLKPPPVKGIGFLIVFCYSLFLSYFLLF